MNRLGWNVCGKACCWRTKGAVTMLKSAFVNTRPNVFADKFVL